MIIRLHNLSARAPTLNDLAAVTELYSAAAASALDPGEEEIRKSWQRSGFDLGSDAWIIVTRQGQVVGYADVQWREHEQPAGFVLSVRVHPEYQGRGVETLLLWLGEVRTRQRMAELPAERRVVLSTVLVSVPSSGSRKICSSSRSPVGRVYSSNPKRSSGNALGGQEQALREVLVREGYHLAWRFWRVVIALEAVSASAAAQAQIAVDLVLDTEDLPVVAQTQQTSMYNAQHYSVYVKELRAATVREMEALCCAAGAHG